MKHIESAPKIAAAKASLDKMLELIGPYLPIPDMRPQKENTSWTLESNGERPKQACEKQKVLSWSVI